MHSALASPTISADPTWQREIGGLIATVDDHQISNADET
jgi:hypothetical protein